MIYLPPGAGPVLLFAAEELRRHAPRLAEASVALGPADWACETVGAEARRGPGHPEGFQLYGDGERYALASKTERGALYAVYALLERMGARFPHPGRTVSPTATDLPDVDEVAEPSYHVRGTYLNSPSTTAEVLALIDWSARRGLNAVRLQETEGLDLASVRSAAALRDLALEIGPPSSVSTEGRCFKHSLGNPYGCSANPGRFRQVAGRSVAAEPYADLLALGRPANLSSVIRQDLEDYFRESYRAFYLVHNGPLSWWTCPLNFDVYARTLWDLNTDPAEVLVDFAAGDDDLERSLGMAEEATAAALCACTTPEKRAKEVEATAWLLPPGSLERALHLSDWAGAAEALAALPPDRRGRFADEIFLPMLRRRLSDAASR